MTAPIMDRKAAEKLAEMLILVERSVKRDKVVYQRTENNRHNMLIVHAVAALLLGPAFAVSYRAMNGPTWAYLQYIPGFPFSFGVLFWIGGLALLYATIAQNLRWSLIGLAILSYWYLALSVGFAIPAAQAVIGLLHRHATKPSITFYAWGVYFHLFVIMRVHIHTLRKMLHSQRVEPLTVDGV